MSVFFDDLQANVDFVFLQNVPFDVVIGRATIKRLGRVMKFPGEVVRLTYQGRSAVARMMPQ